VTHPDGFDVSALGEVLVRLSARPGVRLQSAAHLDLFAGGAEANVLAALARLERRCALVSALPANALGRLAADSLRGAGIDLSHVVWADEGRMGLYFMEYGAGARAAEVLYDRQHSAFGGLAPAAVDWSLLGRGRLFHTTGITAALGPQPLALVEAALEAARAQQVPFSFDVNYRSRLWPADAAARVLPRLMAGAELLFCAARDAAALWGLSVGPTATCRALQEMCGARHVVLTVGEEGAYLWRDGSLAHEAARSAEVIDRIGAGDALAAGVLHGWLAGDVGMGLRCGVALAALAASQHGDMVVTTPHEFEALAGRTPTQVLR
jgi:2-dehydro-3-deoxygluconokinase